jgi:hypothetical protein
MFTTTARNTLLSARTGCVQSVTLALLVGRMFRIFFQFPFSMVSCRMVAVIVVEVCKATWKKLQKHMPW